MNIAVFIDSFKGTLSSLELSDMIEDYFESLAHDVTCVPISDGGEGFIEAIESVYPGYDHQVVTEDPLGRTIHARYVLMDKTAYIGFYTAAGLSLLDRKEKDPLKTSSYGVGLIMKEAIKKGAERIVLGIGGSATNDGASGMLQALGARFFSGDREIEERMKGGLLASVTDIDTQKLNTLIKDVEFIIASDVEAPLLGPSGATNVFASQKGADEDKRIVLEQAMTHYAKIVKDHTNTHYQHTPGAGAAGGVGFGVLSFLKADMVSGIDYLIELVDIETLIQKNDVVVVGEGKLDNQTLQGKAPYGIAKLAKQHHKKVIGLFGSVENGVSIDCIDEVYTITPRYASFEESLSHPQEAFLKMLHNVKLKDIS